MALWALALWARVAFWALAFVSTHIRIAAVLWYQTEWKLVHYEWKRDETVLSGPWKASEELLVQATTTSEKFLVVFEPW